MAMYQILGYDVLCSSLASSVTGTLKASALECRDTPEEDATY